MRYDEALRLLGLPRDHDAARLRAAYRDAARRLHPDRPDAPADATERMAAVNHAYAILIGTEPAEPAEPGGPGDGRATAGPPPADQAAWQQSGTAAPGGALPVVLYDDGSLFVEAPAEETFDALLDAMERIGDLTYVDAGAGLLQVLVRHLDGPFCYLTCSLQGRSSGTEVFTTVERLDAADAPHPGDVAAVLRQLADTLGGA
ncbi:MAG: DnaJ domain-containing protein [Acidimicrobiia bacterium]